jgi:hypothetical protein
LQKKYKNKNRMKCAMLLWGKNIDSHTHSLQEHTHSKHVKPISVYTALAGPGARLKNIDSHTYSHRFACGSKTQNHDSRAH